MYRLVPFLLAILALAMVPVSAHAHKVGLDWRFRDDGSLNTEFELSRLAARPLEILSARRDMRSDR